MNDMNETFNKVWSVFMGNTKRMARIHSNLRPSHIVMNYNTYHELHMDRRFWDMNIGEKHVPKFMNTPILIDEKEEGVKVLCDVSSIL